MKPTSRLNDTNAFLWGACDEMHVPTAQMILLQCMSRLMARLGSARLCESIPLTGVKQTAMLRCGNACN
jgi:hypothetical protein